MTVETRVNTKLLDRIGGIPSDYVHLDRETTPGQPLELSDSIVKWNSVHVAGEPILVAETEAARQFVRGLDHAGELDVSNGLGFVVHHKSTALAFLMIGFWHDKNELWEMVFYRSVADPVDHFTKNLNDGRSIPVACVWELTPIWHERNAWSDYLKSDRGLTAKQTWLDDVHRGIA